MHFVMSCTKYHNHHFVDGPRPHMAMLRKWGIWTKRQTFGEKYYRNTLRRWQKEYETPIVRSQVNNGLNSARHTELLGTDPRWDPPTPKKPPRWGERSKGGGRGGKEKYPPPLSVWTLGSTTANSWRGVFKAELVTLELVMWQRLPSKHACPFK